MAQEIKDLVKNNPIITGLIIGALCLAALILTIAFFILKKRKRNSYEVTKIEDTIQNHKNLVGMSDGEINDLSFDVENSKKYLKKNNQTDFDGVDNLGNTIFHHYAVNNNDKETIKTLLFDVVKNKKSDTLNQKNENGDPPLHLAIMHENNTFIKECIFHGANIDIQNKNGETPIHLATKNENLNLVNFLLLKNANLNMQNKEGKTPFHLAIERNNFKVAKVLNEAGANFSLKDKDENTPLHLLVNKNAENLEISQNRDYEVFIQTLKNGDNAKALNEQNISGDTPLHIAARNSYYQIATRLLKNECNINIQNKLGDTPLHVAIKNERMMLASLLLSKHANQNIKNNKGLSARDLINIQMDLQNKHEDTVKKNIYQPHIKNEESTSFNKIGMPIKPNQSLELKDQKEKTDECC